MSEQFNYTDCFNLALQRIKSARDPHAVKPETVDLKWNDVRKQVLFNYGGSEYEKYSNVLDAAKTNSLSILAFIILSIAKRHGYSFSPIEIRFDGKFSEPVFSFMDNKNKTLLFFKEIEECSFWKTKNSEPTEVLRVLQQHGARDCKYIYLVYDYAYLQVVGHNDDESDPGRGYNVYSIKWFFETYFGKEECSLFLNSLHKYIQEVKSYLGYILLKSLTPNVLVNFRKVTEHSILSFQYKDLLNESVNNYDLDPDEYQKLRRQFLDVRAFSVLLGNHDFAESLITSEWLYRSMKSAEAIDLTVVGMGYIKAVEQLLYELICLHKDSGLQAKKCFSNENRALPDAIPLSTENIDKDIIDFSVGAMATIVKNNFIVFRCDLRARTKKYIRETLFNFADLRNGYFHKHNIYNWDKIDSIRQATYKVVFLLLGSFALDEKNISELGAPTNELFSDYSRLCEYINYHSGELFFLCSEKGEEMLVASVDPQQKIINKEYVQYSGVYFHILGDAKTIIRISENSLPKEIYRGKFVFAQTETIGLTPVKVNKVFENGKFIGPLIADEDTFDY